MGAHDTNVEIITTGDFMNRFCGTLGLARDIQRAATTIAKRAVDLDLVPGRSPISVAAAAIYMAAQASNDKKSQREISDIAGVAEVTIKQSYRLMRTELRNYSQKILSLQPQLNNYLPHKSFFSKCCVYYYYLMCRVYNSEYRVQNFCV